ncbi:MAG: immunity 17 family protein [Planctomycetota bacterium]
MCGVLFEIILDSNYLSGKMPLNNQERSVAEMEWILTACGVFAICGAAFDWEFFMNHRKARFFIRLFGRTGARIFYGLLGIILVVIGVLIAIGII